MAVFTMAMFLGVAAMQWFTGLVASLAKAQAMADPFVAVMASIAALLALAALVFACCRSRRVRAAGNSPCLDGHGGPYHRRVHITFT